MKNNGFTLIELLAVIVILAIIFSIVSITVGGTIDNSESSLSKVQKNIIEHAAQTFYVKEGRNYDATCINLSTLIDNGYLKADQVKDPKTKETMDGSVKITIEGNKYSYEYKDDSCNICTRVETATTGNVSTGNFNYGDEYTCKVGDSYTNTFFVLENNTDTVSLIMKENYTDSYVPSTTPWCTDGGSDNTTCKNITSTGSNASTDKDYIGHIKSIFNKSGVEVSFPTKDQIYKAAGNKYSGLPIWLYDYLKKTTHPVSNVSGYWTITPYNDSSDSVWMVHYDGRLYYSSVDDASAGYFGVRPVITISKSEIQ